MPDDPKAKRSRRAPEKARLEVESLEQRILLSASWVDADTGEAIEEATAGDDAFHGDAADDIANGMEGEDELFGNGGNDTLEGGAGNDTLAGGSGNDLISGGSGHDVASYEHASAGVTVDVTLGTAQETGGDGTDQLDSVEGVRGSSHDDTFRFSQPVAGQTYTVEGGGGTNTLDLSQADRADVHFGNGTLTVDLGDGESFQIEHENVRTVTLGDAVVNYVTWDGEGESSDVSDATNWDTDSAPGASDILVFDASSPGSATFDADFPDTIGGLQLGDDYGGTIRLSGPMIVDGDVSIEAGRFDLAGQNLAVSGDFEVTGGRFEAHSGTLRLDGAGDQSVSLGGAALHDVEIEKAGGTLQISDALRVTGDLTHVSGEVDASAATVEFQGDRNTIDAAGITFGDVVIDGYTFTLASDLDVDGDLTIERLSSLNGETLRVAGDVTTLDSSVGGSATIVLDGANQTIGANGGTGELHDLRIESTGSVTLQDHLQVSGDLTHVSGEVDASAATVEFQGDRNTIDAAGITFDDVVFDGYTFTLGSDLDVDGDLTIERLSSLNGETLRVAGDVTTLDSSVGGSATIVLDGANQTIGANGGTGELHDLRIESTGSVTLQDHLQVSGDLTHVSGEVDASAATVEFQGDRNTIDAAGITFDDVVFDGYTFTLASDLDVDGDLTIERLSSLNGETLRVAGDVTTLDSSVGGSATIVLDGANQTVGANGGTGELHDLRIESTGSVTLQDHLQVSGDLTHVSGEVDASAATVEFQGDRNTIDAAGITFDDVVFDGYTFTLASDLDVDGDLTIERLSSLNGETLRVAGDITTLDSSVGGSATIVLDGANQTIGANGGTGELHDLRIESTGSVTLQDHLQVSGDLTHVSGEVDASAATVEFQGDRNTIDAAGITFDDVVFDGYTFTLASDLDVDGDLTIERLSSLNGETLHVAGDVTTLDSSVGGSATIVLDGASDQTIGANGGTGELHDLRIESTGSVTLQDHLQVSGDLTHVSGEVDASAATVEFQGDRNTIDAAGITFDDVVFDGYTFTLASDLDVDGDLTIERLSSLNGETLHVAGDVTTLDSSVGGSATIVLDGASDQTIGANGGTGELHDLRIEKPDGVVVLQDHLQISGDLTHVSGTVDATPSTVEFQGDRNTIDAAGITFDDVVFDGYTFTLASDLHVDGDLTVERLSGLNGGSVLVAGEVTLHDASIGGSGRIVDLDPPALTAGEPIVLGDVLAKVNDLSGDALAVDSFSQALHGSVVYDGEGSFSYTPEPGYTGTDSFTYSVSDGNGDADVITASIEVEVAALSTEDLLALQPGEIGSLSDAQVVQVTPEQIEQLDSYQSLSMARTHADVLDADQLNAIGHGRFAYVAMGDVSADSFAGIEADQLNTMAEGQFGQLSADQVGTLTPERIEGLDSYRSLFLARQDAPDLSVDQLNAIGHGRFAYVAMGDLSADSFAGIEADQLNTMAEGQFGQLSGSQLATLTPERIEGLDSYRSLFLARQDASQLDIDQLNAIGHGRFAYVAMSDLSADSFAGIEADQLNTMAEGQFDQLSADQLATLTPERIEGLDSYRSLFLARQNAPDLSVDQLNAIGHGRFAYVAMSDLSADSFSGIEADQLNTMAEGQFGQLSGSQLATLTPERIEGLDSYRSLFLARQDASQLDIDQLNAIGHGRFAYVAMSDLSADSFAGIEADQLNTMAEGQFDQLSADQLATLTPERIEGLDSYRSLFLARQNAPDLSVDQLNAIGHGRFAYVAMGDLSADSFSGIEADQLNTMAEGQFDQLSADQLATLTPERIEELDSYRSLFLARQNAPDLSVDQLNAIGHGRFAYVAMTDLSADSFVGIEADQLNTMREGQFQALSPEQVATLDPERILDLDRYRLRFLGATQADHLSPDQLAALHQATLGAHVEAGPFVDAGSFEAVAEGDRVTLQGAAADPNDDALRYEWIQTEGPPVDLLDADTLEPSFLAPEGLANTDLVFELRVSDGQTTSVDDVRVTLQADDDAPDAFAGGDRVAEAGDVVTLVGDARDPEGQPLSYLWVQTGGPVVELEDPSASSLIFTAPRGTEPTELGFELHVFDGVNRSIDTLNVTVAAEAKPEPAPPGAELQLAERSAASPEDARGSENVIGGDDGDDPYAGMEILHATGHVVPTVEFDAGSQALSVSEAVESVLAADALGAVASEGELELEVKELTEGDTRTVPPLVVSGRSFGEVFADAPLQLGDEPAPEAPTEAEEGQPAAVESRSFLAGLWSLVRMGGPARNQEPSDREEQKRKPDAR